MKHKEITHTTRVLEALIRADDFRTTRQLKALTGGDYNQIGAALSHLKKHRAADCLTCEGELWWFATPESDDRSRHVDERVLESVPRRTRRKRQ